MKRSKGEASSNIQGKSHTLNLKKKRPCMIFHQKLQARREWQDIFKVLKGENLQPRLLYLARISFKIDGEIKSFTDKQKLREFSTTKPALQQMLREFYSQEIQEKRKDLQNKLQSIKKMAIGTSISIITLM